MSLLKKLKEAVLPVNRQRLKFELNKQNEKIDMILKKISMPDDIWQIDETRFYVPNFPMDALQRHLVNLSEFFEQDMLEELAQFMPTNPVICDIGSNIGNHALYWLTHQNAKLVYCFEPRIETFRILEKNIKINDFDRRAKCLNIALSDKDSTLSINSFNYSNIGANSYKEDATGSTSAASLDSLAITDKVDFIKIDVEGMELGVLKGAKKTISRDMPVIFLETFEKNFDAVNSFLLGMNYSMKKEFRSFNYLYLPNP